MTTLEERREDDLEDETYREDREKVRATTFLWLSPAGILVMALFIVPTIYAIYPSPSLASRT